MTNPFRNIHKTQQNPTASTGGLLTLTPEYGLRPLDYGQTLDLLTSWEGRLVGVQAYGFAPGATQSHTQTAMAGVLGPVEMVDNLIDPDGGSAAGFAVGDTSPNGFYLSPGSHTMTETLVPGRSVRINSAHGFSVQIDLAD